MGAFASGTARAAEPVAAATPWVEAQAARVRLVAGADAARAGKSFLAGVEIVMAQGWKTYWRNPGEAGVPPNFDWSGSTNTASIKVAYPAPMRLVDPAAEMIGYKSSVLFPDRGHPARSPQAVELRLALEFAVCREICIPAQASMHLTVAAGSSRARRAPRCRRLRARAARRTPTRRGGDPEPARGDGEA